MNKDKNQSDLFADFPAHVEVKRPDIVLSRKSVAESFGVSEKELERKLSACVNWIYGNYPDRRVEGEMLLFNHIKVHHRDHVNEAPEYRYLKWLVDTFCIMLYSSNGREYPHMPPKSNVSIGKDEWLKDYKDIVLSSMNRGRTLITSNTGTGKTELVKTLINAEFKAFVLVPNISHLQLYESCCEVITRDSGGIVFQTDMSYAMVWDQFVRRVGLKTLETLKEHVIILDESHQTFMDRAYREMAEKVTEIVKSSKNRTLLLTATETLEQDIYGIDDECALRFFKKRKPVRVEWIDTNKPRKTMERIIAGSEGYERIAVISDRHASSMWIDDNGSGFLSAKYADNDDEYNFKETWQQETLEKEKLVRKMTYMTRYVCTGINLRNTEKTLLIVESDSKNDWSYIVQAIGRFRCVKPDVVVVHNMEGRESHSDIDPVSKKLAYIPGKYYDAYMNSESKRETKIRRLTETGYMDVCYKGVALEFETDEQSVNPMKRYYSDMLRDTLSENDWERTNSMIQDVMENPRHADPFLKDLTEHLSEVRKHFSDTAISAFTKVSTYGNRKMMDKVFDEMLTLKELIRMDRNAMEWIRKDWDGYVNNIAGYIGGIDSYTLDSLKRKHRFYSRILNMIELPENQNDLFNPNVLEQMNDIIVKEKNSNKNKKITLEYTGNPEDWVEQTSINFKSKGDLKDWLVKHGFKRKDIRDFVMNRPSELTRLFRLK